MARESRIPSTEAFKVQGWCPTAWRPMRSQDGWIVRVRPHCASITVRQWRVLAELALAHAQPLTELTRLGNVQLRGVDEAQLDRVRCALIDACLVPADADVDLAPPVHCTPLYRAGDATHALARLLSQAVVERLSPAALARRGLEALPGKFGFVVDDVDRRLRCMKADIELWVTANGQMALSAADFAEPVLFNFAEHAVASAIEKALWFARERMLQAPPLVRMRSLVHSNSVDVHAMGTPIPPGPLIHGAWMVGVPLGRIDAAAMLAAAVLMPEHAEIRVTPWRSLLVSEDALAGGNPFSDATHWITRDDDVRLRTSSCVGAPRCGQARFAAQELSIEIAPHVPHGIHVHVSGCAKLCALSADATLVVEAGGVDEAGRTLLRVNRPGHREHAGPRIPYIELFEQPQHIQKLIHDPHL
ncbi:nitrite reductase [Diaphorobacter sp. HDW4A]|uniref:nitrite reductase n=1 Tax=Diaphorobacter sp. HDW4A TaxID=2714924 RepID=UPI00140DAD8E|nr:nitrite reductase [Diaphorobacter sp. HDW4A]QIL79237.1 nitrite reductase [Diaphorobacter sp. HDW4A]